MMDESKEGLLSPSQRYRSSLEDENQFSRTRESISSDVDSDLDATEFLDSSLHDPLAKNEAYSDNNHSSSQPAFLGGGHASRFSTLRRPFRNRSRCCMITCVLILIIWALLAAGGAFVWKKFTEEPSYGQSPPWYPAPKGGTAAAWADSYKKAAAMVGKMTLPEKVNVTTGTGWQMGLAVGTNGPAVHVGFPQLILQDGPLGLRFADNATAFPAGITVGATWNKELMYLRGKAHGNEAREKGINVLLGPCIGPLGRE